MNGDVLWKRLYLLLLCWTMIPIPSAWAADGGVRFVVADVFVDSGDQPLAAYQIELSAREAGVKIVGIEGGEHPAFSRPPFYDPKAMQRDRVVIAAFSTNSVGQLPTGKTRVATVHVLVPQSGGLDFKLRVRAAAKPDGAKLNVTAVVEERKTR